MSPEITYFQSYLCVECGRRDFVSKEDFLGHFIQHTDGWTPENEFEAKAEAVTWSE